MSHRDTKRLATRRPALLLAAIALLSTACAGAQTTMPHENVRHEGTWLQWPHSYTYGSTYRDRIESTWIEMTRSLVSGEKVHIVAYSASEQERIQNLLAEADIPLTNVTFVVQPTDDVWVRDNGPVFVYGPDHAMAIQSWGFNGWGGKQPYHLSAEVPAVVARELNMSKVDLSNYVVEGGAVETDGRGTFLATRSSILNPNRNPDVTEDQMDAVLAANLGVSNFIWLDGVRNADITDMHIDGFARFATSDTIATMSPADLNDWGLSSTDIQRLYAAKDANGTPYKFVQFPLTENNVVTSYGKDLGYKGSYVNFYVGNSVVLMPTYNDANDAVAKAALQRVFPDRVVVGIDVRNLYANGGMIHCVTQQQPEGSF
ncbi:agmatine deiminase family protein [Dyella tabacisoli]|uniref:Agmatine deiminase family protein n=1 Tax=Dyella tabacisoli TaxID=2282381 RepID=A0A369UKA0_9GAMM|nr:agmatine deiminase family protein [Dyella tabacisoli]RDD80148.1 agmatine deiminase family protein [Dyella tabacisoli]